MLKRIFYILLTVILLLSSFILPSSAYVIDSNDASSVYQQAYLDLRTNSLNTGTSYNVPYLTWNFTQGDTSSGIFYPFIKGHYSYDPSGYVFYLRVFSSDIYANPSFRLDLATTTGSSYHFTDFSSFTLGSYTYFYKSFSSSEFFSLFEGSLVPKYYNFSTLIYGQDGIFTSVDWGVVGGSSWSNFYSVVDSQSSYNNGVEQGLDIISSLFTRSVPSMSYYFQGEWVDIPITAPDLDSYVTASTVNLSLLQNLGLSADDIPTNNGGVRLTFTLPRPVDISGYAFGSFNPGDIIKRYDPADIRSERYGVWFSDTESDISLWPGRNSTEDNMIRYEYFYSTTTNKYFNQVNIELNVDTLRNILSSSTPINDYVTYNLIDYNEPFDSGYTQGYDKGKLDGEAAGYESGKAAGYIQGKSDGLNEANVNPFFGLFSALIDAPISAFTNLLSFEIFGQNMASFALSILTLLLIIKVVKVVI